MSVARDQVHPAGRDELPGDLGDAVAPSSGEARCHHLHEAAEGAHAVHRRRLARDGLEALGMRDDRDEAHRRQPARQQLGRSSRRERSELDHEVAPTDTALAQLGGVERDGVHVAHLGGERQRQVDATALELELERLERRARLRLRNGKLPREVRRAHDGGHSLSDHLGCELERLADRGRAVVEPGQEVAVGVDHRRATTPS